MRLCHALCVAAPCVLTCVAISAYNACRVLAVTSPCASRALAVSWWCHSAVIVSCLCNVFAVLLPCICNVFAVLLPCSTANSVLWFATCLALCGRHLRTTCQKAEAVCLFRPTARRALHLLPGQRWACCPRAASGEASEPRPVTLPIHTLRCGKGLVQTHLQVAVRGDLENFLASAWNYGELIAVCEHQVEPRLVRPINPSKRKCTHTSPPKPTVVRGAIPVQHLALASQVRVEPSPWMRASLHMP